MSKVILTKEQANEIEIRKQNFSNESTIKKHLEGWKSIRILNLLTLDELIRALYIGYEVEEEFKVGEWIHVDKYGNGKNTKVVVVSNIWDGMDRVGFKGGSSHISNVRHATPEEIAEEKQRRFWSDNNRDLWHIKRFDILKDDTGNSFEVNSFYGNGENKKVLFKGACFDFMSNVKDLYKIVCFAEDRKDL